MEMLLSCSIGNFIFSIFAGQPLIILGGTGPMLVFEEILFQFTESNSIPYLQFRLWIGLWVTLLLIIFVATDASYIIRLFTRFTQESFSVLISLIFIFEALKSVWAIHVSTAYHPWLLYPTIRRGCKCYTEFISGNYSNKTYHGHLVDLLGSPNNASGVYPTCSEINSEYLSEGQCPEQYEHDVFFWSVILFFGTFLTIRFVKSIKDSPFLMAWVRKGWSRVGGEGVGREGMGRVWSRWCVRTPYGILENIFVQKMLQSGVLLVHSCVSCVNISYTCIPT